MTVFVHLWQEVKNIIRYMLTMGANINKRHGEKLGLPFFYPMPTRTKLWAVAEYSAFSREVQLCLVSRTGLQVTLLSRSSDYVSVNM